MNVFIECKESENLITIVTIHYNAYIYVKYNTTQVKGIMK